MKKAVVFGLCGLWALGCDDGGAPPSTVDAAIDAMAAVDGAPDAAEVDAVLADATPPPDAAPDVLPPDAGCTPSGAEDCDGVDDDCDGTIDEGLTRGCWEGPAGTQGRGECADGAQTCVDGRWGACEGQALPSRELCNALDDDCDGRSDEALTQDCGIAPSGGRGECRAPVEVCEAGAWGACGAPVAPVDEVCDGLDNDCDGRADEGFGDIDADGVADCVDADADGDGVPAEIDVCPGENDPDQTDTDGDGAGDACDDDDDDDGVADADDCEPTIAEAFPGGVELCDGIDGDCDGAVDEALVERCYDGPPESVGRGICGRGQRRCVDAAWTGCEGQVLPFEEACDGVDSDCDGAVDEGLLPGWPDADGDGFGDADAVPGCPAPAGAVEVGGDCDDGDGAINPDAIDRPDAEGADTNCDGVDGDRAALVFVDADADPAEADGSAAFPFADVASALDFAVEQGRAGLALDADVFAGPVTLRDGVSIFGGYRADAGWRREAGAETVLRNTAPAGDRVVAVIARDVAAPTTLAQLTIVAGDHPGVGGSSYGVHAVAAPGLRIERSTVRAGRGGPGADGRPGDAGAAGGPGGDGGDCGNGPGLGGVGPCGGDGFSGGRGGAVRQRGEDGQPAGCGGRGGDRGGAGAGASGERGCDGATGAAGIDGVEAVPPQLVDGWWRAGAGADGRPGAPGVGGGGGGGGGGAAVIPPTAGAGGGGGGGGCGGGAGTGGGQGGGSFAVFAVDSGGMQVVASALQSAAGGAGGAGAAGAVGGEGGPGGAGGEGARAFSCGGLAGPGDGGAGGRGGPGGRGGSGRGGDGGPSHALVCVGAVVDPGDSALEAGAGGPGGAGPGRPGERGAAGPSSGCR